MASYSNGLSNVLFGEEREELIMIGYGIKWKCEQPFQATDTEAAYSIAFGQGTVLVVCSSVFHRVIHDRGYDN
jgi:hypothetical protein